LVQEYFDCVPWDFETALKAILPIALCGIETAGRVLDSHQQKPGSRSMTSTISVKWSDCPLVMAFL
jgi:hypothetical protein